MCRYFFLKYGKNFLKTKCYRLAKNKNFKLYKASIQNEIEVYEKKLSDCTQRIIAQ